MVTDRGVALKQAARDLELNENMSMQSSMTSQLVADDLMMAVWRRGNPQEFLHHSD